MEARSEIYSHATLSHAAQVHLSTPSIVIMDETFGLGDRHASFIVHAVMEA